MPLCGSGHRLTARPSLVWASRIAGSQANVGQSGIRQKRCTNPTVSEWHVLPGTLSRPIPRSVRRLGALFRWWMRTTAHIAAVGSCKIFPYMPAMHKMCQAGPIPPVRYSLGQTHQAARFELACSVDMQRLWPELRWFDYLDLEAYAKGFEAGAKWASSNACKGGDI